MKTLLPLLIALSLIPIVGCTDADKERMAAQAETRKRKMAQQVLEERAKEYWEAHKWQDWATAATFLKAAEDQFRFLELRSDSSLPMPGIQNLEVQYVFVSGVEMEQGEVRVKWVEAKPIEGRVADGGEVQKWYKQHGRWWLDPEDTLLSTTALNPGAKASALDESPLTRSE